MGWKHAADGNQGPDLSRLLPGPFASQILADYGAEVIKVEDTGVGDYLRDSLPLLDNLGTFFGA